MERQHRFQTVQIKGMYQAVAKGELEFFPGWHNIGLDERRLYRDETQRKLNTFLGFNRRRLDHEKATSVSGERFDAEVKLFAMHLASLQIW